MSYFLTGFVGHSSTTFQFFGTSHEEENDLQLPFLGFFAYVISAKHTGKPVGVGVGFTFLSSVAKEV